MQTHDQAGFHVEKIRQQPVIKFRGQNLYETDRAMLLTHLELLSGTERKGAGGNKVLSGETGRSQPFPLKAERNLLIHVEDGVELGQPGLAVQRLGGYPQPLEVVEDVRLNPFQPGLGSPQAVRLDAERQVLGFNQAIVAFCQLVLEHLAVLRPDGVEVITLHGNLNAAGEGLSGGHQIEKGQLKVDGAVKIVEEITPALEDRGFILILAELVVDVLELNGFGITAIRHLADAVRPHPLIRDAVLGRFFLFIRAVGTGDSRLDLLFVGAGQPMFSFHRRRPACFTGLPVFLFREQCHTPPCRVSPAVPARRRSYWSGTGAPWAG